MIENKCIDCKCRRVGCHSLCSEYKKYKEQLDQIHIAKAKEMKTKEDIILGYEKYYKSNKYKLNTCKFSY